MLTRQKEAPKPTSEKPTEPPEEILFKNLPYTVKVSVAIENRGLTDQTERDHIVDSIREAIARMYGRMWIADVKANDWLVPATKRHLEWLTTEDVFDRYPETEWQEVTSW